MNASDPSVVIYYEDRNISLYLAIVIAAVTIVFGIGFRHIIAQAGKNAYVFIQLMFVLAAIACLYQFFDQEKHPVAKVMLSEQGIWCEGIGSWLQWKEIKSVSYDREAGRGGRDNPDTAILDLREEYVGHHPPMGNEMSARCRISGLNYSTNAIISAINRYQRAASQ